MCRGGTRPAVSPLLATCVRSLAAAAVWLLLVLLGGAQMSALAAATGALLILPVFGGVLILSGEIRPREIAALGRTAGKWWTGAIRGDDSLILETGRLIQNPAVWSAPPPASPMIGVWLSPVHSSRCWSVLSCSSASPSPPHPARLRPEASTALCSPRRRDGLCARSGPCPRLDRTALADALRAGQTGCLRLARIAGTCGSPTGAARARA